MNRLQHQSEFDAVFRCGKKIKAASLTMLLAPNTTGVSRLGLVIAKRFVADANKRNRLKRLIRESFRHMKSQIGAHDLVVLANKSIATYPASLWAQAVTQAMHDVCQVVSRKVVK